MTKYIDAHQHFWKYSPKEYGWIDEHMSVLRRDFLPSHLHAEMTSSGVHASIAVQARQTLEETEWLLELAAENSYIAGVVGWAPIASIKFPSQLDRLSQHRKFRGLRHVLQAEPDDAFMLRDDFNRGISLLKDMDLVYDILIYERHLPKAIQFVDRHPYQRFVVDHLAKPKIRTAELSPWREHMRSLAERPHVTCKLSGLVTEADWSGWKVDDLRPYVEIALDAFGPRRVLAGSDWPVCTLACGYKLWWETLQMLLSELSDDERNTVLGGNAVETYKLKDLVQ